MGLCPEWRWFEGHMIHFSYTFWLWITSRLHLKLRQSWVIYVDVGARSRAPSQYPKSRLSVRSRKVSKPRDLYLELSDRSEICQALRQQCCRCACQISKRYDNLKYRSRGFETLRDLTERRLFGYWDGALVSRTGISNYIPKFTAGCNCSCMT